MLNFKAGLVKAFQKAGVLPTENGETGQPFTVRHMLAGAMTKLFYKLGLAKPIPASEEEIISARRECDPDWIRMVDANAEPVDSSARKAATAEARRLIAQAKSWTGGIPGPAELKPPHHRLR